MAVHRLLLQRPAFRLRTSSLIESRRWHSSSAAKQELTEKGRHDGDSLSESKSTDKLSDMVLEAAAVRNKVGKSFYGLFTKVKEVFVNPPVNKQRDGKKLYSKVELEEEKGKVNSSRTMMDLQSHPEAVSSSVVDKPKNEDSSTLTELKGEVPGEVVMASFQQDEVVDCSNYADVNEEEDAIELSNRSKEQKGDGHNAPKSVKYNTKGEAPLFESDELEFQSVTEKQRKRVHRTEVSEAGELDGHKRRSKIFKRPNRKSKIIAGGDSKGGTNGVSTRASDGVSKVNEAPATSKNAGKVTKIDFLLKQIDGAGQSEEKSNEFPHAFLFGNKVENKAKHDIQSLLVSMANVPTRRGHQCLRSFDTATFGTNEKLKNGDSTKVSQRLSGEEHDSKNLEVGLSFDEVNNLVMSESESISEAGTLTGENNLGPSPAISGSDSKNDCLLSQNSDGIEKICFSMKSDVQEKATPPPSDSCLEVLIPDIIGDPDVPVALVKHPTRTIKVANLTSALMLHQLEEALEQYAGSGSTSTIFLGPTSSVAYAEFKTEEAKERAIAKHSINIEGNHLEVYRIDTPKTTVVRISLNTKRELAKTLKSICKHHGEVSNVFIRARSLGDVHFEVAEWPNMLNILNSLNGMEVDGQRLVALPAPVYPRQVLEILWKQHKGRKHVKSVLQSLIHRINSFPNSAELMNKVSEYYQLGLD